MFPRPRSRQPGGSRALAAAAAFVTSSVALVGGLVGPAGTLVEPWIDTGNRDAVVVAWAAEQARPVPDMEWSGSHDGCEAGEASQDLARATVGRVNFYRAMAGVPASVRLNDDYSVRAQHAALTMSATGQLSHAPDGSFACVDDLAREGAANSNLYLGRVGPSAVDGYIEDPGERNRDVGHRNTILHPPTTEMGVGHVAGTEGSYAANALWVFDDGVFDQNPAVREADGFVAWPPRGHVPGELIHPRWSLGLVGADFEHTTVTMTVDGQPVPIEIVTRHSVPDYVPSPIIVWEPDPVAVPALVGHDDSHTGGADIEVDVVVAGVEIDGRVTDFRYRVTVMPPGAGQGGGPAAGIDLAVSLLTAILPAPLG